ncbi:MAG: YhbD family protein [Candidatus Methanoplasma sp.]|jgi:DNA-binding transcriptional MerR regulator|nr:YhbD family protein [Candidatus Methanoplasma sp.]
MDEELISKKELLELKGISYGTLYRWKRKQLIPDEWFIRKSTFTGQETFFPRDLILERVDSILNSKAGTSLDDLAEILSGSPMELSITLKEMKQREMISETARFAAEPFFPGMTDFDGALITYAVGGPIERGDLSLEDARTMIQSMMAADREAMRRSTVSLYRKHGVAFCIILFDASMAQMDAASKLVFEMNMPQSAAAFKEILSKVGVEDHE